MLDIPTLAALGVLALALAFAFRPRRGTNGGPGRDLIDSYELAGKVAAGSILEKKLGEAKAAEIIRGMREAFADPSPNATSPKSGT